MTQTFRGRSLAEVLPKVKEELGSDAVAVSVRHGRSGGVGGFFAQRCVEVDAVPAAESSGFERALAAATEQAAAAPSREPVAVGGEPAGWERLLADAEAAPGESPAVGEVLGRPPAARGDAAALAAMFTPDVPVAPVAPGRAAAAPAPEAAAAPAAAAPAAPMVPVAPSWPEAALAIHRTLIDRGMDAELVAQVVGEAVDHLLPFSSEGALRPLVAGQLARCLRPLPRRRPGRLVLGFVGAGGAGKTRCAARLALAYARRGDRDVLCLTLRPKDRGAELMADLAPAGVPVHAVEESEAARTLVDGAGPDAIVVVDTPGVSPHAEAELRALAGELRRLALDECHLALPATLSPFAAGELVRGTRSLGVDALALTHVDETAHIGAAIGAAIGAQLPISYVGRGPGARTGLRPALVEALALELVG